MNLDQVIRDRRSIRNYTTKPLEEELLLQIIDAGRWAPSACNDQNFHFIIIKEKETFDTILAYGAASFIKNINTAVLVLYKNTGMNQEYKDYVQSGAACVQNMLLKAHSLGLGACWVCNLPSQTRMRKIFEIPSLYEVIALVTLGYPTTSPRVMQRKQDLTEIISHEKFTSTEEIQKLTSLKLFVKRTLRKIYYHAPKWNFVRKIAGKLEKKFDN